MMPLSLLKYATYMSRDSPCVAATLSSHHLAQPQHRSSKNGRPAEQKRTAKKTFLP